MTDEPRLGEVRRGRPPLAPEQRCKAYSVRLDQPTREALASLTERWNMSFSEAVRRAVLEAAKARR